MNTNATSAPWRWGLFTAAAWILLSGCNQIEPGAFAPVETAAFSPAHTAAVRVRETEQWYEAVGTVRPRSETRIDAQVTGQVLAVAVNPGDLVSRGALLVSLDSRQLTSRIEQAQQGLKTAEAVREQSRHALAAAKAGWRQAQANFKRVKTFFDSQAATSQELEAAEAAYRQAEAGVKRTEEALAAAESGILQARAVVHENTIALDYTQVLAPEAGVVLKRLVEPGDLAQPGSPLVILRTTGPLRLNAYVREGLIHQVATGDSLLVEIETLGKLVDATVEEIIPYADPNSRTFLVKAAMPHVDGLFPGMFGKLRIPVGRQRIVTVPASAVWRVGQLELVRLKVGDTWQIRHVTTGLGLGAEVEILSGLDGTETVGWEVTVNE